MLLHRCLVLLLLFGCSVLNADLDFGGSIEALTPDPLGLTVTSFRYNPTHKLTDWYTSIFGDESVWYNVSQQSPPWMAGASTLGQSKMVDLKQYGRRLIREGLGMPDFQKKPPPCSIEILAYGRVDLAPPLMRVWRDMGPVLGQGSLQWQRKHDPASSTGANSSASSAHGPTNVSLKCYWRALFENWRKQNAWTAPNFWAMLFFCPLGVHESPSQHAHSAHRRLMTHPHHRTDRLQCTHLERTHDAGTTGGVISFNLSAALRTKTWKAGFTGRLFPSTSPTFNVYLSHHRHKGGRIHKYNGRRRLDAGADEPRPKSKTGQTEKAEKREKTGQSGQTEKAEKAEKADRAAAGSPRAEKRNVRNIFLDEATGAATGGLDGPANAASDGSAPSALSAPEHDHDPTERSPHMAVCCIVPYTTTDPDKQRGNGAMMLEWAHYYDKLGFHVFMYDRDGHNERYLRDAAHTRALFGRDRPFQRLHYFNYTIRGLLDPARSGLKYDNTERMPGASWGDGKNDLRPRYEAQGHDKVNTFTHCRFEAKAVYGIDRVLAVDFDEFLYCPSAPPNAPALKEHLAFLENNSPPGSSGSKKAKAARLDPPRAEGVLAATAADLSAYLHTQTAQIQAGGLQQLTIAQRLTMNKTSSALECLVERARERKSILSCYGSYRYERAGHSIKSFHLGTTCPLTGYHQACPSPSVPRALDCGCATFDLDAKPQGWPYPVPAAVGKLKCALFHLSTNPDTFADPSERHHDIKPAEVPRMIEEDNELTRVLYGQ